MEGPPRPAARPGSRQRACRPRLALAGRASSTAIERCRARGPAMWAGIYVEPRGCRACVRAVVLRSVRTMPTPTLNAGRYGRPYAAIGTLDIDLNRDGLPPGGPFGPWSSADKASRTSSIVTIRLEPGSSRNAGLEATAAASEAHDARMARFSAVESVLSATTSRG